MLYKIKLSITYCLYDKIYSKIIYQEDKKITKTPFIVHKEA